MRIKTLLPLAVIIFAASIFVPAQGEPKFDFYTRGPYRENVPKPQSILRYDVGDHHTTYAQMEKVVEKIAAASDRVKVYEIGTTNEHRMQHLVAISAPENIARIDEIRRNTARLADPRGTSASEAAAITQNTPAIAWMAYTIHGNESASFEAFMQVIYQLAASDEPATVDILKNTVVLVLTGENPDGHERFVTWYNSVATGNPDRNAIEHREPWAIYGRLNHYRFDLNRDTLPMTQKETRNMIKAYNDWNPQLAVDHHGQPSQYFFPPVALPVNPNFPQPTYNNWLEKYGRANAAAFDKHNWDYYVRDVFDAFYPGYWDTYPSLNGAVGMTYETDGGGFKGLNWTRDDGTIVTLRSAIAKHFVASMTTLEVTAKNKAQRMKDFYEFRVKALADHTASKMKRVVIVPQNDRVKAAELAEILINSNIEVRSATSAFSSRTAHSYMEKNSPAEQRSFPPGSYIVDLDQPQRLLIKSILEPDTPQDKAFVDDNMARFNRNQMRGRDQQKEGYGFYDLTAWSLPLAFGVDAFWTEETAKVQSVAVNRDYLDVTKRGLAAGKANIAYIIPYNTDAAGPLVVSLLQRGFKVAVATRPLNAGGKNWKAGTFVVRVSRNHPAIHEAIALLAQNAGVHITAANSGFADEGDTSIGGEAVVSLRAPRIAIAADEGIDQSSYGSIWWTFDKYGTAFTPMTISTIRGGGLQGYNVLILPDGSAGRYFSSFGASGVAALKTWVSGGGTIITVRGASAFAAMKDVGLTTSRLVGNSDNDGPAPAEETEKNDASAEPLPVIISPTASRNKIPEWLPGSIMRASVDRTTHLNYGMESDELPVLMSSGYFFQLSKEGTNAIVFRSDKKKPLTISGFVWEGNTEELMRGTAYLIGESMGGGSVSVFADDPFYRGLFRSATRPFYNSVIFGGL